GTADGGRPGGCDATSRNPAGGPRITADCAASRSAANRAARQGLSAASRPCAGGWPGASDGRAVPDGSHGSRAVVGGVVDRGDGPAVGCDCQELGLVPNLDEPQCRVGSGPDRGHGVACVICHVCGAAVGGYRNGGWAVPDLDRLERGVRPGPDRGYQAGRTVGVGGVLPTLIGFSAVLVATRIGVTVPDPALAT